MSACLSPLNKRILALAAVFWLCVAAAYLAGSPAPRESGPVHIPASLGRWEGRELPVDDEIRDILRTQSVFMREYRLGKRSVTLALVYYPDTRVELHLPESCYTGQGSHIVERGRERLGGFPANRLRLEGRKGDKLVYYYYTTGGFDTDSYLLLRLRMMRDRLYGRGRGCALVRLAMASTGNGLEDREALASFAREFGAALDRCLR